MHTTSSNALTDIISCFVLSPSEVHMFSGQTPAASFTWRARAIHSANDVLQNIFNLKFLIVVTSEGEAMQRFVPGQTCFREKVMGGTS